MTRTPTPGEARYERPDASMSLLINIMDHSLDEGYAEATARRAVRGEVHGGNRARGTRLLAVIGVALIAAVVTLAAIHQVRVAAPRAAKEREDLVNRIHAGEAEADRLQDEVEALRDQVDAMQDENLSPDEAKRVGLLAARAGADPVEGPGVKIVVDDAEQAGAKDGANQDPRQQQALANGRVLDRDLQRVVNGLWAVGAEAIGINGQRLTALSAIRAAGASILVDNRPLSPPYTVLAIGDAKKMRTDFPKTSDGIYLHDLTQRFGLRATIGTQKKIKLPAAIGMTLRVALPEGAVPATGTTATPVPAPGPTATPGTGTVSPSAGTTGDAAGTRTPSSSSSARPTPSKSASPRTTPSATGTATTGATTRPPSSNATARNTGAAPSHEEGQA
ncbi:DUF881 domain-containing protein [Yinghuangia sp. YIM S10712]|uniref:DUF881 domain-containing protein n=1 Tax=Yinghuangia sp. YIM S10712 TaxID=3436930 RepID=UPI003F52B599